jgi:hypothetical protein
MVARVSPLVASEIAVLLDIDLRDGHEVISILVTQRAAFEASICARAKPSLATIAVSVTPATRPRPASARILNV